MHSIPLIGMMILWKVIDCKPRQICNMNLNSVIQSCKVKLCSNIFEAADNNFDDLNSVHWDQYPKTMVTWYYWELSTDCSFASGMCADHNILPQGQPVGRMTSLHHGGHVRLGVNFMSWSNFCVLVWLSLPWRDFSTLSEWYYSDMRSRDV